MPTQLKVPKSQSAKICPNLHFQGGEGGPAKPNSESPCIADSLSHTTCPDQLNPKCQDLSKYTFSGGEGWRVVVVQTNILKYLSGGTQGILTKIISKPNSGNLCVADSLSFVD